MSNMNLDSQQQDKDTWGGDGIHMTFASQHGTVEFDCAHGEISGSFKTDADDRFDLPGTFTPERGGPIRLDRMPESRPVRYVGRVQNGTMILTITFTDNNESVGSYSLTRGKQGRIRKCL
ncbi:MAG: hypothetical protein C5B55_01970 [Blastocatellia bacterium]|nr:MAG: hypothetical protein C5B55_01970 [Blastocatellia bacterium]